MSELSYTEELIFMKNCYLLLGLLLLMLGCSKEPAIIVKEDIDPIEDELIELIEQTQDDLQTQQFLEFVLLDQQITLNLNNIPVLANYLEQHSDREKAIQEMQLTQILSDDFDSIYLLSFACQNDACSYLLLNTEIAESQLLADQAQVVKIEASPGLEHLLIVFKRSLPNHPWDTFKLSIYDIENWTEISLIDDDTEIMGLHRFNWPIFDTVWLNETELEITFPNIETPDPVNLNEWHESDNENFKKIIVEID